MSQGNSNDPFDSYNPEIEDQEEESEISIDQAIREMKADLAEWDIEGYCAMNPELVRSLITTIESQNSQIESLKAITELAVKENERLKSLIFRMHEQTGFCSICGNGTHHDPDCEIERLQNEK